MTDKRRSAFRFQPFYLRTFCALIEGRYPPGTYGHSAVMAVLAELRSHAAQGKRAGRCLLCGGER